MATPEQPLVTQADLDAYIASYQKAQADQAAALARAQATGLSDQYTQLYGGADIIPGMTQGIFSNLGIENPYVPVYSLIGSESVGNNLSNERMQFAPTPGVSYRLVDKNTGETTTATTPEEIKALIAQSNALSAAGGKKADLAIESNQTGAWSPVFTDAPNPLFNDITKIALAGMILATGAGLAQPGGLGGLSSAGATGATGAGTAAGAAGLAPAATVAAAVPAATAATTDLVVTALMAKGFTAAQAAALVATGGAAAALSSSAGAGTTTGTTAASNATNTMPPATTTGPDLLLTAQQAGSTVPAVVPATVAATTAAATSGSGAGANTTKTMPEATTTGPDLTLTAPTSILPAVIGTGAVGGGVALADALSNAAAANAQGATTSFADTAATRTSLTPEQLAAINAGATAGGVFGTGLTLSQLATLGSLGASAVGSLFGGGSGGTGTGTPYVSPFGAGPAIGGADFRVNPNIQDYERYGFGGEATFFRPEYNKLVASGSMMGYTPPATTAPVTTTTPTYTPLIGGMTTGGTTNVPAVSPTPTPPPPSTPTARPPGFTGTMADQQVGDTQVVDGTTWSYGGSDAGWQMQYMNDAGQAALLPGNGATNVSSFANNPTVAVNQPYFAQNTANIPGWAETYQGFQRGLMSEGITGDRKAAAERELFTAIETQPFANPQALVDYARTVYNKYTAPTPAATSTNTGGILGALTNAGTSTQSPLNMTQEQKANFINALAPGYDPNQPMVWNGPYVPSGNPMPIGNLPEGAANVARGLIG